VREGVELRADLGEFGQHHLLVGAALVGLRVHEGALQVAVEAAGTEERHGLVQLVAEFHHAAGADQPGGLLHLGGGLQVHRAAQVGGTPAGRAALGGRRR
jgi:hypothetical protein